MQILEVYASLRIFMQVYGSLREFMEDSGSLLKLIVCCRIGIVMNPAEIKPIVLFNSDGYKV